MHRIVLTGFMGSGKTTVGRLLAERLTWTFLDLDREVERHARLSVPAIFAQHGEAHFRHLEAEVLSALLAREYIVLALGGGAPEFEPTANLLRAAPWTHIVYLSAPFSTLAQRCETQSHEQDAVHRPLFEDRVEAERRFSRREPLYGDLAHQVVSTGETAAEDVAELVLSSLRDFSGPPPRV